MIRELSNYNKLLWHFNHTQIYKYRKADKHISYKMVSEQCSSPIQCAECYMGKGTLMFLQGAAALLPSIPQKSQAFEMILISSHA